MRIAYFDTVSGISGDMTLAACVSAGVPFDTLVRELRKLPLDGYTLTRRTVTRSMISAVKIDVILDAQQGGHRQHTAHSHTADVDEHNEHIHPQHTHTHEGHAHEGHTHEGHAHEGHAHEEHAHEEHAHEGHAHGRQRGYREIVALIDASTLAESVRERAKAMFLNLANAEARVHDMPVEQVHFHEVGAVDSIIDIVGTAICIEMLDIDAVYSSPLRTGSGTVIRTQHGMMPVPAPATMELLKGYPVELTALPYELTTPTGATIIATLSSGVLPRDAVLRVDAIGYGAGTKEFPELPNMLRLVVGELDVVSGDETLLLLETNIDDMNPELYPHVIERLIEAGARDAWLTPVLMKKGRPAYILSVLGEEAHRELLLALLWNETSTIGVRMQSVTRRMLPRHPERAETRFGEIAVKQITRGAVQVKVPEFEECRRIAWERNLPLIEVYHMIEYDIMLKRGDQAQPGKAPPKL